MSSEARQMGAQPIGPGRVVLIVGPSGSGKDTLLRLARKKIGSSDRVVFPARIVTRTSNAPDEEAPTTPAEFAAAEIGGDFALVWRAHGLDYAIPAAIDLHVKQGQTVVLNLSRTVIAEARARYANVVVVLIDAPAEVRAARLAARGRESGADVAGRLSRLPAGFSDADADHVIVNTAEPEIGASMLARFIAEA